MDQFNNSAASKPQAQKTRQAVEIIVTVEQLGVTALTSSRFTRVKVKGSIESRFGKYQLKFTECEETRAEYRNPIFTILARAGVPKVRGEIMQADLGEDFAHKIAADPSLIQRLFPRIKGPGTEAILVWQAFVWVITYIFAVPVLTGIAAKGIALDAKLDSEKREDETRVLVYPSLAKIAKG
jgi:hypothetical protein